MSLISEIKSQRQADFCDFDAKLLCVAGSMTTRVT